MSKSRGIKLFYTYFLILSKEEKHLFTTGVHVRKTDLGKLEVLVRTHRNRKGSEIEIGSGNSWKNGERKMREEGKKKEIEDMSEKMKIYATG